MVSLSKFISKAIEKSLPFFKILRNVKNFKWTPECDEAFNDLKKYLSYPPLLAKPIERGSLFWYLAVNKNAVSFVLIKLLDRMSDQFTCEPYTLRAKKNCLLIEKGGAGAVLKDPEGIEFEVAVKLHFAVTNNEDEYVVVIAGMKLALRLRVENSEENKRADALSKFASTTSRIKSRKFTLLIFEHLENRDLFQDKELHDPKGGEGLPLLNVQAPNDDGITSIIRFLQGERSEEETQNRKMRIQSAKFTMFKGELYKRTPNGVLLKCVNRDEADYILREVHEGSCGNHFGDNALAQKVLRQGYF
ncbi:UNVERIFIED_CONTAM: hypothetical protein Sangu_3131300 [Sesamum angustifolium]|uniref:Reverse transcriptase/retrotransposon-derived protein RNase H-like domain-containing protein n=1 Tax=Sesamum angustifolium TaxID=2727405 RepID=A0AAW2K147_9LAMI